MRFAIVLISIAIASEAYLFNNRVLSDIHKLGHGVSSTSAPQLYQYRNKFAFDFIISHKERAYFLGVVNDTDSRSALYETDGTPNGTRVFFQSGTSFSFSDMEESKLTHRFSNVQ